MLRSNSSSLGDFIGGSLRAISAELFVMSQIHLPNLLSRNPPSGGSSYLKRRAAFGGARGGAPSTPRATDPQFWRSPGSPENPRCSSSMPMERSVAVMSDPNRNSHRSSRSSFALSSNGMPRRSKIPTPPGTAIRKRLVTPRRRTPHHQHDVSYWSLPLITSFQNSFRGSELL